MSQLRSNGRHLVKGDGTPLNLNSIQSGLGWAANTYKYTEAESKYAARSDFPPTNRAADGYTIGRGTYGCGVPTGIVPMPTAQALNTTLKDTSR